MKEDQTQERFLVLLAARDWSRELTRQDFRNLRNKVAGHEQWQTLIDAPQGHRDITCIAGLIEIVSSQPGNLCAWLLLARILWEDWNWYR